MKSSTLTRQLFLRTAPILLIAIAAISFFAFKSATKEINHVYDAQLINDTNILWSLFQKNVDQNDDGQPEEIKGIDLNMASQIAINDEADDYAYAHMFRLWKDGHIQLFSSTAIPAEIPIQPPGFTNVQYEGEEWRIYSLPVSQTSIVVEVGGKTALRQALVTRIMLNLVFPLLVLFPTITLLIWIGIKRGLRPIYGLVQEVRSRTPDAMSPLFLGNLPPDLHPLGLSINQLLHTLERSLQSERRFSDLAAHQLRTPQAGIKLLLQMLASADSEEDRRSIALDLVRSNDRAMRLIEQLLHTSRVNHYQMVLSPINLYNSVAAVMAEMGYHAAAKRLDLSLQGSENAEVLADDVLLQLMVTNLIDNAVKYTPVEGRIEVTIASHGPNWHLSVIDNGPGIASDQQETVFQRFHRGDTLETEGAGLGLAIVADIVRRFSASIILKEPRSGQGLWVEVHLPRA
ncbi:ATP-binding protein [Phyllobacterium sp. SB3]|uniref:sensor histidine kinase n=1 Tax=Phyllobacterium sp. SB3 TaxID=3156073 RepID=UPI0032AF711B